MYASSVSNNELTPDNYNDYMNPSTDLPKDLPKELHVRYLTSEH